MEFDEKESNKIIKKQLVSDVAYRTGISKLTVETVINTTIESIKKYLLCYFEVKIAGFGTFRLKKTSARVGRNLNIGKPVIIKGRMTPQFIFSKTFKALIEKEFENENL